MDVLNIIMSKLNGFVNLFDSIRIVDPANKISVIRNADSSYSKGTCYSFWLRNKTCSNCISMRALLEKETFIKIEYCQGKIYLITATPIEHEDQVYIVEMLKDITEKNIFFDKDKIKETDIVTLIDEMNEKSVKDSLTGVFNRSYANERLYFDLKVSLMNNKKLYAAFINISNYKEIKRDYGQDISDDILKSIADLLAEYLRNSSAWVSRYAEDEFLVALSEAEPNGTNVLLGQIKESLEEKIFNYEGCSIEVQISFASYGFNDYNISLNESINSKLCENKTKSDIPEDGRQNNFKLEKTLALDKYIDDIRDVLNEISLTSQNFGLEKERLIISQCLDELIVEYYK